MPYMFTRDGSRDCVHGSDDNLHQCWGKSTMTGLCSTVKDKCVPYMFTCDGSRDCVRGSDENLDQCWGKLSVTGLCSTVNSRINMYRTCLYMMDQEIVYTGVTRI